MALCENTPPEANDYCSVKPGDSNAVLLMTINIFRGRIGSFLVILLGQNGSKRMLNE